MAHAASTLDFAARVGVSTAVIASLETTFESAAASTERGFVALTDGYALLVAALRDSRQRDAVRTLAAAAELTSRAGNRAQIELAGDILTSVASRIERGQSPSTVALTLRRSIKERSDLRSVAKDLEAGARVDAGGNARVGDDSGAARREESDDHAGRENGGMEGDRSGDDVEKGDGTASTDETGAAIAVDVSIGGKLSVENK